MHTRSNFIQALLNYVPSHKLTTNARQKSQNNGSSFSKFSFLSEVDFGQLFFGDGFMELATSTGDTKDPGPDVAERVVGMMAHQRMVLEWKIVCEGLGWEG